MDQSKNQPLPTPDAIMQLGMGFWGSKILLAAVQFKLFTLLAEKGKMTGAQIKAHLGLRCLDRHVFDFLDALASLGMLNRDGLLYKANYSNSVQADVFLDKKKPSYIGGMLEMANHRLYRFWGDLEQGLKTGKPQNELKAGGEHPFTEIYKTPEKLEEFINAMTGIQMGNFMAFAEKFNFSKYKTLVDAGGSGAMLSIMVAKHQHHMHCTSFDLPAVEPVAVANIKKFHLSGKVSTASGDFFSEPIPAADIVVMGNVLHDWDEEKKLFLMRKAFAALPSNGAFVAIENIIDDERRDNTFGLMFSLNMLIETGEGFDYTFTDFKKWAKIAGFTSTELIPLAGPSSAAVAYK
jgi:hypothetical protein